MSDVGWAWAGGMLVGVGVLVLLVGGLPEAPPDLSVALARLDRTSGPDSGGREWTVRAARWASSHLPVAGRCVPAIVDLRLLGRPAERLMTAQVTLALAGLAVGPVSWTALAVAGLPPPAAVPPTLGLGLAVAGWAAPVLRIRRRAAAARVEFRRALSAYLDLVALERAGRGSPSEALEAAAAVGQGWVFTRLRRSLAVAALAGTSPYAALAELAEHIGVPELTDLADIAAVAADGAAVYGTLLARARTLRHAVLAADRAAANTTSERLVFPVTLLGTGFLLMLFYPALVHILA